MTTKRNAVQAGSGTPESHDQKKPKTTTKLDRVIAALHHPHGLNRFEAERIGEHAINSTVAVIRKRYGSKLVQEWETVPTRYCERGVRVLRYWIVEA